MQNMVNTKSTKENPPFEHTHIESLSHDGKGIAHINNKVIFLKNALPNEEVSFNYTSRRNKYNIGEVVEVLKSSPDRVSPICKHYEICGGCSLQHLDHQKQISFKTSVLQEQLKHIGGLETNNILPAIVGPTSGYRNKARLSVKHVQKKQKTLVGFHEKNGIYVTETEECPILHPSVGKKISLLAELISNLSIYQQIPQIEIACGDDTTILVLRNLQNFSASDIELLKKFSDEHQLQIYSQSGGKETVKPIDSNQTTPPLVYKLLDHGIKITFAPTDFTQINPIINAQMVNRVLELLDIQKNEKILDLFCGIGNFTLPIATKCGSVIGVEGSKSAIIQAKQNAENNNIENVEFYCADLTKELSGSTWAQQQYDKILLDPPRTGALEICAQIKKFNAKKIVYVSCNPSTLARDAKEIVKHGYELQNVTLVDMYPHTSHMEIIANFS